MRKWKGPPGEGRADPKHVQAAGWNTSDYADDYDDTQAFVRLGTVARGEVVALWWRLAAQGVRLPAQRDLIVFDGGVT
jgi:hypothetical protein